MRVESRLGRWRGLHTSTSVNRVLDEQLSLEEQLSIGVAQVSKDETLVEFCRDVVSELFGADWALVAGVPGYMATLEDLSVWDFTPRETPIPQGLEPAKLRKHWFVVHRKDLPALQAAVGTADLSVLLKPLSPGALGAFSGGANPKWNEQNSSEAARLTETVER